MKIKYSISSLIMFFLVGCAASHTPEPRVELKQQSFFQKEKDAFQQMIDFYQSENFVFDLILQDELDSDNQFYIDACLENKAVKKVSDQYYRATLSKTTLPHQQYVQKEMPEYWMNVYESRSESERSTSFLFVDKASLQVVKHIQDSTKYGNVQQTHSKCVGSLSVEVTNQKKCNKEVKEIVDEALISESRYFTGTKYAQRETTDYWVSRYYPIEDGVLGRDVTVFTDKNFCKVSKVIGGR